MQTNGELKFHALNMWANHIEPGPLTLCAEDLLRQHRSVELKQLNSSQKSYYPPPSRTSLHRIGTR